MDAFEVFIKDNNFVIDEKDNLRWTGTGLYRWEYVLYFEGYAYVLYQIYRDLEVPLAHFRDAEKLKLFYQILNTKIE